VKIFDVGVIDNHAYILLEYIESGRLDRILEETKKFTVDKTLNLLEDIANALIEQEKHNIMAYTEAYASPDHYNKSITNQSDLYQLGLTAWQCLSGEILKNLRQSDFAIPELKSYRQDVPAEVVKIIDNLVKKEASQRYKTAKDLLDDIYLFKYHDEYPVGAIKGSVFIAISYDDRFNATYKMLNRVAHNINLKCIRMDRLHFQEEIWKNIALEIEHSDIIIADFSELKEGCGTNSNVITEASHARAIGKKIIIITQDKPEDLPFDWRYLTILQYSNTKEGLEEL